MLTAAERRHEGEKALSHLRNLLVCDSTIELIWVNRAAVAEESHLRPGIFPIGCWETVNLQLIGAFVDIHRARFVGGELLPRGEPVHHLPLGKLGNARFLEQSRRPGARAHNDLPGGDDFQGWAVLVIA